MPESRQPLHSHSNSVHSARNLPHQCTPDINHPCGGDDDTTSTFPTSTSPSWLTTQSSFNDTGSTTSPTTFTHTQYTPPTSEPPSLIPDQPPSGTGSTTIDHSPTTSNTDSPVKVSWGSSIYPNSQTTTTSSEGSVLSPSSSAQNLAAESTTVTGYTSLSLTSTATGIATNLGFPPATPASANAPESSVTLPGVYGDPGATSIASPAAQKHAASLGAIIGGALGGLALLLLLVVGGLVWWRRTQRTRTAPSAEFEGIARGTTPMPLPLSRPSGASDSGSGGAFGLGGAGALSTGRSATAMASSGARLVPLARQRSPSFEGGSHSHGYDEDEFWSAEGGEEDEDGRADAVPPPPFTPGTFADPLFDKVFEAAAMREHYARQERESWPGGWKEKGGYGGDGKDGKELEDAWSEDGEKDGEGREDVTMRSEESTIVAWSGEDGEKGEYGWAI
ncbi:hypothetical protein BC628DRAFT_1352624 [Trametes gibbosa]|nr:hypothetical protein BC628DRAFT_1352624 [Trametes gibbosa]